MQRSLRAFIHRPNVNKLLLIFPASFARLLSAPDRPIHSDPAKSTKLNFPTLSKSSPSGIVSLMCTVIENTEWERLITIKREINIY